MDTIITYVLFVVGFVVLVKGADFLVEGASGVARRFGIPELVIGLTIVAFGTSTPELVVNIISSIEGKTDIAIGNVLGSNISNILLILGASALVYPLKAQSSTIWKEIPLSILAGLMVFVLVNDTMLNGQPKSEITRGDGFVFLGFFAVFMTYIIAISKQDPAVKAEQEQLDPKTRMGLGRALIYIAIGLVGLVIGGTWIVNGAVTLATSLGVSESLIGLTIVAIGTSLPELATSVVAAYKKNSDIAIGNVVGSNIFNIFWILGISSVINPLPFNPSANTDVLMTIFVSVLLFAFLFFNKKREIARWMGGSMIFIYVSYLVYLIIRG